MMMVSNQVSLSLLLRRNHHVVVVACMMMLSCSVDAFMSIQSLPTQLKSVSGDKVALHMVDPLTVAAAGIDVDLGIALTSAAVGAWSGAISQVSKIDKIEREHLETSKLALLEKELEIIHKLNELKDKLYNTIDYEYDNSKSKFQNVYDRSNRDALEQKKDKIKLDLMTKYSIKLLFEPLDDKKSSLLKSKYELVCINEKEFKQEIDSSIVDDGHQSNIEVIVQDMNLKINLLEEVNHQLDDALKDADNELENMRNAMTQNGTGTGKKGLLSRIFRRGSKE